MTRKYNSETTRVGNPFKQSPSITPDVQKEASPVVEQVTETEQANSTPSLRGSLASSLTEALADYTVFDNATDTKIIDKTVLPKLKRI